MSDENQLGRLARSFADDISNLLNGTVTDGIRMSAKVARLPDLDERFAISYGKKLKSDLIPVTFNKRRPVVFLYLQYSCVFDKERKHLAVEKATMSIYSSSTRSDESLVVGSDFARHPEAEKGYPAAHLHVAGERTDIGDIYLGEDENERKSRKLRDLHFPVGGKRFRPTLEDLIEFMVTERMATPKRGWEDVVAAHRERWIEIQTMTVVRDNPDAAARQLKEMGWDITPPAS